jgi:hypothetical protein
VFLFLPLARIHVIPELVSLISGIFVAYVSYYFFIAVSHSGPLMDHVSSRISSWIVDWKKVKKDEQPIVWRRVRKVLGIGITLVVYLAYRPLLWAVNPVFAGIGLLFIIYRILKLTL